MKNFDCQECGRLIEGGGEVFHPYWYCVLQKAGQLDVALKDIESQKLVHGDGYRLTVDGRLALKAPDPKWGNNKQDGFKEGLEYARAVLRAEQRERNKS